MATPCVPQLDFGPQSRNDRPLRRRIVDFGRRAALVLREFDHYFRLTEDLASA